MVHFSSRGNLFFLPSHYAIEYQFYPTSTAQKYTEILGYSFFVFCIFDGWFHILELIYIHSAHFENFPDHFYDLLR